MQINIRRMSPRINFSSLHFNSVFLIIGKKPMKRHLIDSVCAVLLLTGAISSGCKDDVSGTEPIDIVFPPSGVSYGKYIQPLFDRGCTFHCHEGQQPPANLNLETYQEAISSD